MHINDYMWIISAIVDIMIILCNKFQRQIFFFIMSPNIFFCEFCIFSYELVQKTAYFCK